MSINQLIAQGTKPIEFESPMNQLAKVMQMQRLQQAGEMDGLKMEEYQQGKERKNKLVQLMGGLGANATDEQRSAALKGGGYFDEADKLDKGALERRKIGSEAGARDIETAVKRVAQWRDFLGSAKDPEDAARLMAIAHSDPGMKGTPMAMASLEQNLSHIGQDPQSFDQWKKNIALGATKFIEANKPTYQQQDLGGTRQTLALPGLGGAPTVASTAPITQSPDNAATQATSRANNAATIANAAQTARMADSRARDLNANAKDANRIAQDNKPLTEGQSKSVLFGSRMQEANDILETLAKGGTDKSTPGMNSGYGVGSVVSALSSNDQQQLMQAKRNFVNAVLRRESGAVIADSEFANAEKQYFPQIGDTPEVIAQKKTNREAATRGVLIDVPESRRERLVSEVRGPKAAPIATVAEPYKDTDKESRYQAWKRSQAK